MPHQARANVSGHLLPYFDVLLERLAAGDPESAIAFGRHVHWGYWSEPSQAAGTAVDYAQAAEAMCRQVVGAAGARDGLRVLDVGCGFGGTVATLNEIGRDMDLVGVNIDPRQLVRARQLVKPINRNHVRFIEADACRLPFSDGSFDIVLAVECIFHFPSRTGFLMEASRVLAAGGVLVVSDFVPPAAYVGILRQYRTGTDEATRSSYGEVDVLCTIERYRDLADASGLRLADSRNVTACTLPTYPFLRAHNRSSPRPEEARHFDKATARLELASHMGWLEYTILRFEKPGVAVTTAA